MFHQSSAGLHQPLLQTCQRPVLDSLGQRQPPPQIPQGCRPVGSAPAALGSSGNDDNSVVSSSPPAFRLDPSLCDPTQSFSTYAWQPSSSVITVTIPAVKAPVRTPTVLTVGTRPISPSSRQLSSFGSSANRNLAASPSSVVRK